MKENKLTLVLCASAAAFFISIFDLTFNGLDSLPMKIGEAIRAFLFKQWDTYAWFGLLIVVLFSGFICFLREPKSKVLAGEIGLGIISLITTLASPVSQENVSHAFASAAFVPRAFAQSESEVEELGRVILNLHIDEKKKKKPHFLIQIRDANSDKLIGTQKTYKKAVELKDIRKKGEYIIYLESQGHKWTKFKLKYDGEETVLKVKLEASDVPMLLQRFTGAKEPTSVETLSQEDEL